MKKRRLAIASFLLVAVLVMGVGYAALTDNLFIKGEATLATTAAQSTFDDDVYFSAASVKASSGSNTATADSAVIGATDKDSATFYVKSLGNKDESVTFKFTINNDSTEFDAKITLDTGYPQTTDATNFSIIYSIEEGVTNAGEITCEKGNTIDVYVKIGRAHV